MIFLSKRTALVRNKPLHVFLHVFAEVRRTLKRVQGLCVVLYYNCWCYSSA